MDRSLLSEFTSNLNYCMKTSEQNLSKIGNVVGTPPFIMEGANGAAKPMLT